MILLVHLIFGALIGQEISTPILAVILAFLSHYLLDFIPHIEYSIENITKKCWKKSAPDIFKVFLDFFLGILLIFIFSKPSLPDGRQAIIYACAFSAILPDGLAFLNNLIKNKILEFHNRLHAKKIHFLKYKKISNFWRIASQVAVVVISTVMLKF